MIRRFGVALLLFFLAISATAQQLITNGGFESGSTGWSASGNFYIGALPNPHSGSGYAYLSNPDGSWGNNLYGSLSQSFTIPSNVSNATLSFWISISTNEPTSTGHDFLTAYLAPSNTLLVNLSNGNAGGYQQYSFNVTAFAGQTVTLQFVGTTNSTYTTTFRVDDVSATYVASAPAPPTNLQVIGATGAILLQWQNNAANATNIEIQRAALGGSFGALATIGASSAAYRDVVAIGNIMCYEVRATNSNGVSAWAGPLCGTSIGPPTLSYPPDNATLSNATVNLSWQSALAANQYGVDVGRSCGGTEILNNASSNGQVSYNLPVSTGTYVWRVRSANTNYPGVSDPSSCRTFTIGSAPPPVPTANFTWSPQPAINNQSVSFTDQSTNATSWSWNFGDGGTSSLENPSHTYASSGNFTVTLTATNSSGSNAATKTVAVLGPPVASFSVSPSSPVVNQQVTFTDNSSGSPATWSWNFGDGQTSSAQNSTHSYASTGSYTVTLTVTNAAGSNNTTRQVSVGSNVVVPTAAFSWSPQNPTAGQQISFVDGSTGGPTSWTWTFGDNTSSSAQNPMHTYASAGTYQVILTAANSAGSNTTTHNVTVSAAPVQPKAGFSYSPQSPVAGQQVSFTDTSTGGPSSWSWNFGDGGTSSVRNPSHAFSAAGRYNVVLKVQNGSGTDSTSQTVSIGAAGSAPVANFGYSPSTPRVGEAVVFTDTSSGLPTSWSWIFSDGKGAATTTTTTHTFDMAGTFTVALGVANTFGSDSITKQITVAAAPPTLSADFSFLPANPFVNSDVQFTDRSSGKPIKWLWSFDDGSSSTAQNPKHAFSKASTYHVLLTASDGVQTQSITHDVHVVVPSNCNGCFRLDGHVLFKGGVPLLPGTGRIVHLANETTSLDAAIGNGGVFSFTVPSGSYTLSVTIPYRGAAPGVVDSRVTRSVAVDISGNLTRDIILDSPIVLIHGINSHPDRWSVWAHEISQRYPAAPILAPGYDDSASYPDEAASVKQQLDATLLDMSADVPKLRAIVHSKGGLVVRALAGVYTEYAHAIVDLIELGTPNQGVPCYTDRWPSALAQHYHLTPAQVAAEVIGPYKDFGATFPIHVVVGTANHADLPILDEFQVVCPDNCESNDGYVNVNSASRIDVERDGVRKTIRLNGIAVPYSHIELGASETLWILLEIIEPYYDGRSFEACGVDAWSSSCASTWCSAGRGLTSMHDCTVIPQRSGTPTRISWTHPLFGIDRDGNYILISGPLFVSARQETVSAVCDSLLPNLPVFGVRGYRIYRTPSTPLIGPVGIPGSELIGYAPAGAGEFYDWSGRDTSQYTVCAIAAGDMNLCADPVTLPVPRRRP